MEKERKKGRFSVFLHLHTGVEKYVDNVEKFTEGEITGLMG